MHIIYNLVTHKLQGSIEANSDVGAGTSFNIKLPKTITQDTKQEQTQTS